jgi:c-di-GMP-binding flagellar brake protein YcgR
MPALGSAFPSKVRMIDSREQFRISIAKKGRASL